MVNDQSKTVGTWITTAIYVKILELPRRDRELIQNLDHHWCSFYDNIGRLPTWISNVLYRAVTGTGVSKRALYTDDDDVIACYKRCLGLTGINIAAESRDLLEHCVLLGLEVILKEHRKTEAELRTSLESQRPKILGAMLDVIVKALNFYPDVNSTTLNRMADFTIWGCAITRALGIDPQHFLDAYGANINAQNLEAVRTSPISDVIIKFMHAHPLGWSGTATQRYSDLDETAKELKISTRQKAWPKKPHILSRVLNELISSLPSIGLKVEREHSSKSRLIHIKTVTRKFDWGKGEDLKAYLDQKHDGNDATDTLSISLSCNIEVKEAPLHEPSRSTRGAVEFPKITEPGKVAKKEKNGEKRKDISEKSEKPENLSNRWLDLRVIGYMMTPEKAHGKLIEIIKNCLLQEQQETVSSVDLRSIVSNLYTEKSVGDAVKFIIEDQVLSAPRTGGYHILSAGDKIEPNRVCSDCRHHLKTSCVQPQPKLIQPNAVYALFCLNFESNENEG